MTATAHSIPDLDPALDLILVREVNAPRDLIYTCWTTPEHLVNFFVPRPNKVTACQLDVRVDGMIMQNHGVYLEVVPNEKLVFTGAYTVGWKPAPEPFMTAILLLEDIGDGRTRYTAIARHRNADTAKQHADMGFQDGWGTVVTQLEEYARGLMA